MLLFGNDDELPSTTSLPQQLQQQQEFPGYTSQYQSISTADACSERETIRMKNKDQTEAYSMANVAVQDQGSIFVKATYGDDIIKFELPFSSRKVAVLRRLC